MYSKIVLVNITKPRLIDIKDYIYKNETLNYMHKNHTESFWTHAIFKNYI